MMPHHCWNESYASGELPWDPGCFRCHDGSHVTKAGQALSNDCSLCHNLLAVDETNPTLLNDLGLQSELRIQ